MNTDKIITGSDCTTVIYHGELVSSVTGTRKLAIKSLRYSEGNMREARILLKLSPHRNVVSVVHSDVYKQGVVKYIYIAMELCHTQTLQDHIMESKSIEFSFDSLLSVSQAKQIVEGLAYIHGEDIIHRDLKPQNILFSLDKKFLMIADFGLSKPITRGITQNSKRGTDGYRAPETYISDVISKFADIYSLGLVIYFIWSQGEHPFGDDPIAWPLNIKMDQNRNLDGLLVGDHAEARALIEKMLMFQPEHRAEANEIMKDGYFRNTLPPDVPEVHEN